MKRPILIPDKYHLETLDYKTERWVKDALTNWENTSDEELIEFFQTEGKLSEEEAKLWVSRRSFYENNFVEME